jgi:exosortase A
VASSLLDPHLAVARRAQPLDTRGAWRHALVALAALIVAILVMYGSTAMGIVRIWARSETFAHGFVVVPIVLWLVWRMRGTLASMAPRPAPWALVPIALAGLAWLAGRLAEVNAAAQFAMTAMIVLAVVAVLGMRIARKLAFPLAFLFFAVPFGEVFLPFLMDWTANFTVAALRLSGIPVYKEGLVFVIPSGTWSVIEACSGVRYLIASLMVGTLYAYLTYRSNVRRWLFIMFAAAVPIVANWIRAYLIVLLGHVSGNRLAVGVDHLIYGWIFFAFVILLMFWIGGHWREDEAGGGSIVESTHDNIAGASTSGPQLWSTAIAALVVAAAFPLAQARFDVLDAAGFVQLAPVTPAAGWSEAAGALVPWRPAFEAPSAVDERRFSRAGMNVGLYIAYYRNQDSQRRLVASSNVLVRSNDRIWRRESPAHVDSIAVGGMTTGVHTAEIVHANGGRLVAWQFYWIDGRLMAGEVAAKLATALARLRHGRDDSAVVVVYTPAESERAAEPILRDFLRDEGDAILAALVATRERR